MQPPPRLCLVGLLSTILASLAFIGCATPQPLVRLAPASEPVVWVAGRATLTAEKNGVRVGTAFERQDGSILGLRVEVQNETDEPFLLDPAGIWFTPCATAQKDSCQRPWAVINPEQMLADLAQKRSIEVAEAANEQAFYGTLVILSAASLSANSVSSSVAAAEASGAHHDLSQLNTTAQQQLWSDVALRRNTVLPGQGVGGRVFIPIHLDARFVWLHVRVGGQDFTFRFTQTVVPVKMHGPVASSTNW